MYSADLYVAESTMEMRVEEELRRAQARDLLSQIRNGQRGWLSRQGYRLLHRLGHCLVALGEHLDRYGQKQSLPTEARAGGGR
jgi:hypothetical protein